MMAADRADEGFWHAAYREHGPAVLGFLLRRLGGRRDEAEDLLQETFTRAIRLGTFQPGGNLRAYLLCIARNLLVNRVRRPRLVISAASLPQEDALESTADSATTPEDSAVWSALRERLDGVLATLTHDHRTAFEMAIVEQHSYGEISRHTGWSLPRVKSNVYRARRRVIHELADLLPTRRGGRS
jgi:RNA polymerase sigma-70 factor (ECF subfamily)